MCTGGTGRLWLRWGTLMDVKFAGAWRSAFDATKYFKGNGEVYDLGHTTELTDLWYMKQSKPDGSDRKLKEVLYAVKPLFNPQPLTIKAGRACLLLAHGKLDVFRQQLRGDVGLCELSAFRRARDQPDRGYHHHRAGGRNLNRRRRAGPELGEAADSGWLQGVDQSVSKETCRGTGRSCTTRRRISSTES